MCGSPPHSRMKFMKGGKLLLELLQEKIKQQGCVMLGIVVVNNVHVILARAENNKYVTWINKTGDMLEHPHYLEDEIRGYEDFTRRIMTLL